MGQAVLTKDSDVITETTPSAGYASGEVIQLPDGRAAFNTGLNARTSGEVAGLKTSGQVTLLKTASIVILKGAPLYWDRSANTVTPLKALAGADFFVGVADDDAASAATTVVVNLNVEPEYTIDLLRDETDTVLVNNGAASVGPGYVALAFTTATEAQKSDYMSKHSIPIVSGSAIPFIVEGRATIADNGDDTALDFNIGVANETHASNADTIGESLFLHLDGNTLDLDAESDDDDSIEVSADTLVDVVEDTYFDFAFDCRDLSDIKIYVNGARVLSGSTFSLAAAAGPLYLLCHLEKSATDSPGEVRVSKLALRAMDVAA